MGGLTEIEARIRQTVREADRGKTSALDALDELAVLLDDFHDTEAWVFRDALVEALDQPAG